jgi:hypothetical protein
MALTPVLVELWFGWRTAYMVYSIVAAVYVIVTMIVLRKTPADAANHPIPIFRISQGELRLFVKHDSDL